MSTGQREEFFVQFTPFGEAKEIRLTESMVREFLEVRTKTGKQASPADVRNFLELCAAQGLNPWVRDAFLVGYDMDGGAKFNLITSHQALLKRAEFSQQFNGIESGVIVSTAASLEEANGENTELREGDFVFNAEMLLGAWGAVYRKDRDKPFRDRLHIAVFNTDQSRWKKDPAGMIVKCAEASCLRKAFPSALAGLYCQEEMDAVHTGVLTNQAIGLPDGRQEQADNKIVIPTESMQGEKVPVERRDVERQELNPPVTQESVWPVPIENLMGAAKRAKTEMSLLSVKQGWLQIKGDYGPEIVEEVERFFKRRASEVIQAGEKPKS